VLVSLLPCQVRCTHPLHPNSHKLYALKLVMNYDGLSKTQSIANQYGRDCEVLERLGALLPRHPNLCSLLIKFTSIVPDEMLRLLPEVCSAPAALILAVRCVVLCCVVLCCVVLCCVVLCCVVLCCVVLCCAVLCCCARLNIRCCMRGDVSSTLAAAARAPRAAEPRG
jgi:hypothetical protein